MLSEIVKWDILSSSFRGLNVTWAKSMHGFPPLLRQLLANLWGRRRCRVLTWTLRHPREAWRSWCWGGSLRLRRRSSSTTETSLTGFKASLHESKKIILTQDVVTEWKEVWVFYFWIIWHIRSYTCFGSVGSTLTLFE